MGVIWTPGKRERQPQAGVQLSERYQGALFSAIASQPRIPIRRSGATTQIISSDGYSVGPGGAAWKVLNGSGTNRIILADSTGGANGPVIPSGGSWTAIWHCRLEALGAGNPGFFRSGSSAAGSTFVISNGSTGRPWIRVNGSDVLTPGSGSTFPLGLDTVFVVSMASGARVDMAWDGAVRHSATHSVTSGADQIGLFGWQGGVTESIAGDYYSITWLPWAVSPGEAAILSTPSGYYGNVFEAENYPVFYSLGGGGSTVTGVGASDGAGTATGIGASTAASVGSSIGAGTVSGIGSSTADSVGSSSGTGAADGVGSSTGGSDGVGASTGTGTASGIGASTAASTGSSDGVGTASGIGASTAASVGSAIGTGEALGVGANGSVVSTGVGSASGTGTATGISPIVSTGGGKTTGKNLSRKQKKKLKAVESQEWLKAEETARQLLSDRFTKQTPQEKAQALETYIESLQPVIEALKALTSQIEEVVEEAPVIELTPHQEVIQRFDRLEKKVKSVEELIIILMADL